jgi:hypothetical protein
VRVRRYRYVNPLDAGMEGDANGKQTSVIWEPWQLILQNEDGCAGT